MALRDAFGFLSLPRAGLEAGSQELRRSRHELAEASRDDKPSLSISQKGWGKAQLKLADAADSTEMAIKQLGSMKNLVRCCEPPSTRQRAEFWFLASGGFTKQQAAAAAQPPAPYARWAASAGDLSSAVIVLVDTDARAVGLTWRQHPLFNTIPFISALSNIVVALLASNPRLGYSRQLTHMVAFTLVVFGGAKQEEQVFWTIKALLEDKLFGYCQGQWLLGVRVEQEVLSRLAARKLPRLTAHLASLRMGVASFTQPWLSSLFVSHLPPETLARVWDVMMMEGPKVLLRTGLALLKMYEQTLSSCSFPEVLRKVLDLRVSRTTDAPALLKVAFKGCGSLPGGQVDAHRQEALQTLREANPPDGISRYSPTMGGLTRAGSPLGGASSNGAASGNTTGGGVSSAGGAAWSLFGPGGSMDRRHSSGTGGGSTPPQENSCSTLAVPASPGSSGSDSGAATTESRETSPCDRPVEGLRMPMPRSRGNLSSMLARLMGGPKADRGSGDGAEEKGGRGMHHSATTGNMGALAAY